MSFSRLSLFCLLLALFALSAQPVVAQSPDEPAVGKEGEAQPTKPAVDDPALAEPDPELGKKQTKEIPEELKLVDTDDAAFDAALRSLEIPQLETLLEFWKGMVVNKNSELGKRFRAAEDLEGEERERALGVIERVREEQTLRKRRFTEVLERLRTATGDADAGKASADLVAGLPSYLDLTDPNALWNTVRTWIMSKEGGVRLGLGLLRFIGIIIVFRLLSKFVSKVLARTMRSRRAKVPDLLREFFANTSRKVIMAIGLVIALGEIGVNIAPLVAGIGVLGFVIGFALQDTLGNFAAGIMILINRPYDVGHFIDAAGAKGTVSQMNLFSTTLRTPDNQTIVIPNGSIWGGVITNITGNPTRRVDLEFGIAYEDDVEQAEKVLADIVSSHPKVLKDPAPMIRVGALADSSVNFVVRPWVKTADYWDVNFDLTREVKVRFDREGISIPYPQRQVHMNAPLPPHEAAEGDAE